MSLLITYDIWKQRKILFNPACLGLSVFGQRSGSRIKFFLKDYFLSLNMYDISELLLDVFLSKIYIKECNWIWVNFHLGHLGTCEVTESGKYLIGENNSLFCPALCSVHTTFL